MSNSVNYSDEQREEMLSQPRQGFAPNSLPGTSVFGFGRGALPASPVQRVAKPPTGPGTPAIVQKRAFTGSNNGGCVEKGGQQKSLIPS